MHTVLLTTDTTHHLYYAWKLSERHPLAAIVVEGRAVTPPFEVRHPFEDRRDEYEREVLLAGCPGTLADLAPTTLVDSIGDAEVLLRELAPDVALVFGTGRLPLEIARVPAVACLNLHGGNPEAYRGLDTHLWAVYHRDFANLVTTLHHVDEGLDTGDIVLQSALPLARASELHELRAVNAGVCVELSVLALESLRSTASVPSRKQLRRGRYYSFMPAALKERCLANFDERVAGL